jgi:general secretion pathway protein G
MPLLRCGPRAFTLIEILIVVTILGIIATIVIPQFPNASLTARENMLKDELRYLRTQVVVYKAQHHDVAPGYPGGNLAVAPTAAVFANQMTKHTDDVGNVSATASSTYKFGPYLSTVPTNPMTKLSGVLIVGDTDPWPAATDRDYGWYYRPFTGDIMANCSGTDSNGMPFSNY